MREGKHLAHHPIREDIQVIDNAVARYFHEMREGLRYPRNNRFLILLATSWAMFLGAMLTNGVITAPLSDRMLRAGAAGYGWLNAGGTVGAVISTAFTAWMVRKFGARPAVAVTMLSIAVSWFVLPFSKLLAVAVMLHGIGGAARGVAGVALSTTLMENVPKHFMGRVQNTIYFARTSLQLILGLVAGEVAHRLGLAHAFAIVAAVYFGGCVAALIPARESAPEPADATAA